MRKWDQEKTNKLGKAAKTINFDRAVLKAIEDRAKKEGTTASNIINTMCRQYIITDSEFYHMMAKEHFLKFQECRYLQEQSEIKIEARQ